MDAISLIGLILGSLIIVAAIVQGLSAMKPQADHSLRLKWLRILFGPPASPTPVLASFANISLGVLVVAISVHGTIPALIVTGLLGIAGLLHVIAGLIAWRQARRRVAALQQQAEGEFGRP
jgi:hypothetical protein